MCHSLDDLYLLSCEKRARFADELRSEAVPETVPEEVPEEGFEPSRTFVQWILSPSRLPLLHSGRAGSILGALLSAKP